MNERIRELMAEVGMSVDYLTNTKQIVLIEKFAELIVRECAEVASDWDGAHYVGTAIEKHFGVES
jgi:hypothetical protein